MNECYQGALPRPADHIFSLICKVQSLQTQQSSQGAHYLKRPIYGASIFQKRGKYGAVFGHFRNVFHNLLFTESMGSSKLYFEPRYFHFSQGNMGHSLKKRAKIYGAPHQKWGILGTLRLPKKYGCSLHTKMHFLHPKPADSNFKRPKPSDQIFFKAKPAFLTNLKSYP